jgi:hypothetical protein
MLIDGSLQEEKDFFEDNQTQDLQQIRDAMNAQEEVSEPFMDDPNLREQGHEDDDTGVEEPVENQATDQEDSIIDETLDPSTKGSYSEQVQEVRHSAIYQSPRF